jgi:hypothetical protein
MPQVDIKSVLAEFGDTVLENKGVSYDKILESFPELKDYDKKILAEYGDTVLENKGVSYDKINKSFPELFDVKKKADSSSSLDISAGPYASGQKPKGFGEIVSEKISEVTPQEEKQTKKQAEDELSKKDTYINSAIRGLKTAGTTLITGLKDLDTGLSILGKKVRDTFGVKDAELDEELESKLDDNQVVSIVRDYQKEVDKQSQEIHKLREQTGGSGITENISKGNYAKALDYTGKTFVESLAPSLMFLNPLTATMSMGKTVGDEMQQAKSEGRIPTATDVTAGAIKGAAEYALTAFLGVGKVTKKAVNETLFRKEASDAITKMVKSSFGKKVATTIVEEGFEEGLTQIINNGVDIVLKGDKTKGWFDGVPDNVIVGMFGGGTQGTIANLILDKAEKKQAKEQEQQGTPTVSEEQQNQLNTMPNKPQLPPDEGGASGGNLMTPEGMQQAGVESPEQTQLAQANQVIQEVINNDNVATSIEGQPVDIKELTPEGFVLIDGQVVPIESVMVESELGTNPLVDVINEYINQQENAVQIESTSSEVPLNGETGQTIPQGSEGVRQGEQGVETTQQGGQEKVTVVPDLPKKIFHATNAQFEGQPSRQEQSKVSAFGTEPAGLFYSTNPDQAKQAIGNGESARIIEADFNPKNPLVINNINDEIYSNTLNESKQQAIQELSPEYNEAGVDLTTLEEGEIPEAVNKRTSEIFAEKLKEQGFDAVVNNENGDIIILDDSVVADITNKSTSPTNEIEKSQQIQELKDELDALDAQDDSKLTEKEKKRIKNAIRHTVTSIARGYFLDGGKILWDSLKKETGFKGGEFKDFLGVVSKTGRTVDGIANYLWENRDNDQFEDDDYRNAIIEILSEPRDEWYVRQRNEVDADSNQNVFEQKQKIQEQIDILEDSDLSFEDIKNELEANEAMWEQKFKSEGNPKQKSGTFVNKELESDIPKVIEYLAKMKELEDGTKKRNIQTKIDEITSKDAKLKKIIENFDVILKQLNYTSDC